jgi:hypothetical protein
LSEVLATPADAAKERAARRLALDGGEGEGFPAPPVVAGPGAVVKTPTVNETPTEGELPAVGVESGDLLGLEEGRASEAGEGGASELKAPTVEVAPTVGDSPGGVVGLVGGDSETPTVDDIASVGESGRPLSVGVPPTVGDSVAAVPDVVLGVDEEGVSVLSGAGDLPAVGDTPTVPVLPTVGVLPERDGVVAWKSAPTPAERGRTGTVGHSPTVGVSEWVDGEGVIYVSRKVIRVQIAPHCLTLGEERFYQEVWHAKESDGVRKDGPRSKVFSMGYDRLAKLVRLDEKSVRQLIPKLVAKRVLEVLAGEDSSARIGRTYRIFSYEEILERQRAENMRFVIKKGRAVVFVWPLEEMRRPRTRRATAGSGIPTEGDIATVGDLYRDDKSGAYQSLVAQSGTDQREVEAGPVEQALNHYVRADGEAARMIIAGARRCVPNATMEEIVYFIHDKGRLARAGKIANPLAYLLVYVPKCFEGEGFRRFREEVRRAREVEEDAARQAREELAQLRNEWQAWLSDPEVGEADKLWARKMLADG